MKGRYRVAGVLHESANAEVLEAYATGDRGFERRVAIKRLSAEAATTPSFIDTFVDEARIASQLHHANIVGVLDFGVVDDRPFLVLELVDGLDARALLGRAGPLPDALALHVVTEIGHALDYAHRATDADGIELGVVHRDVSSKNILLSWNGDVKLTDFGIAFAHERASKTQTGFAKGTSGFMSPEQLWASGVDERSDIFSLGCVLVDLICRAVPLADEDAQRAFLRDRKYPIPDALTGEVRAIVERATQFDRRNRFESAAALADATGRALASRIEVDTRSAMKQFLSSWTPNAGPALNRASLFEFEPVVDIGDVRVRRFSTVAPTRKFGSYVLRERLGRGGMGEVYRADHAVLDRVYALKIVSASHQTKTAAKRLLREAKLLSKIDHPNIVEVVDVGETDDGAFYVVMELLDGRRLLDFMNERGPLAAEIVKKMACQLASGLAAMHAAGIVHRDLKPENIMVIGQGDEPLLKIIDFGIAKPIHGEHTQLTHGGAVLGSPSTMAPEQRRDASTVGPPADVYALGAVMYRALTGDKSRDALPPEAGGLGPIIVELLADHPDDRPTAQAVLDAISDLEVTKVTSNTKTMPRPVPPAADPRRGLPRGVKWSAAVVSLALAALGGAFVSSGDAPRDAERAPAEGPPIRPPRVAVTPRVVATPPPPESTIVIDPPPDRRVRSPRTARGRSDALEVSLEAALRTRGLRWADLDGEEWPRWQRRTPAEAARLHAALLDRIQRQPIRPQMLAGRLSAIARRLESGRLSADDLERLEGQYLDLSTLEAKAKTEGERAAVAKNSESLLRAIKAAEKR